MHFSFIQKFGAALLATVWLLWGSNMIGDWVIPEREIPKGGTAVVATAAPTAGAPAARGAPAKAAAAAPVDIKPLLAKASVDEGEKQFKKCVACHTAARDGGNKVGPALWNVIGRTKAAVDGFRYSDALKGKGGDWTYDDLDHFIANPKDFAPGTKMTFAGIKKADERAALIAYMRTLSDSPPPLP